MIGLVCFYGITNIEGYSMPNSLYIYMCVCVCVCVVWFGFISYQLLEVISYQIQFIHKY